MRNTFKTFALALTTVLAGGIASAQGFSPAQLQLSAQAGVEPGVYSVGQLHAILKAERNSERNGDPEQLKRAFLLEDVAQPVSAGARQLAEEAGVDAGTYSTGQLYALIKAGRSDDQRDRQLLLDAYARKADHVTPGLAQLAARAGIDPAGKSAAEIVSAYVAATSSLD